MKCEQQILHTEPLMDLNGSSEILTKNFFFENKNCSLFNSL
jgi:hypothetical protein